MCFKKIVLDEYEELKKCHKNISNKLNNYELSKDFDTELYLKLKSELFVLDIKLECFLDLFRSYALLNK